MTDHASHIDPLLARLMRLETENQRIKRVVLAVSFGVTAVLLIGSADSGVVEAERFVMKDGEGRMRAVLEMSVEQPTLGLYDSAETLRFELVVSDKGPWMRLYEASGAERAYFGHHDEDGPALDMSDPNGTERIILASTSIWDGLLVYDGNNVQRAGLSLMKVGPQVFVRGENKTGLAQLISTNIGPILHLQGLGGRPQALLQVTHDTPLFGLYRTDGKTRFSRPRTRRLHEMRQEKPTEDTWTSVEHP